MDLVQPCLPCSFHIAHSLYLLCTMLRSMDGILGWVFVKSQVLLILSSRQSSSGDQRYMIDQRWAKCTETLSTQSWHQNQRVSL